jgi:hypothetical protein
MGVTAAGNAGLVTTAARFGCLGATGRVRFSTEKAPVLLTDNGRWDAAPIKTGQGGGLPWLLAFRRTSDA